MSGRLVSIYGSKGGTGKTFLAVNLAVNLALETRERVLLLDMGAPVSADAQNLMELKTLHSLDAALAAPDKVTAGMLETFATAHASGVSALGLLGGRDGRSGLAPVAPESLAALLAKLLTVYGYVVADCGPGLGPALDAVVDASALVLVPAVPEFLAIHRARLDLDWLRRRNHPTGIVKLVLNRDGEDEQVAPQAVERIAGRELFGRIPYDKAALANMAQGRTYPKDHPRHPTTKAFDVLTHAVVMSAGQADGADGAKAQDVEHRSLDDIKRVIHRKLLETFDLKYADMALDGDPEKRREMVEDVTRQVIMILDEQTKVRSREERDAIVREILQDVLGLGVLEDLLSDPGISEIMVNRHDLIYVERSGRIETTDRAFLSESHLMRVIERIVAPLGRKIDVGTPMVDARLPDGSRVNAIIPPLAIKGGALTIRKFPDKTLGSGELIRLGTINAQIETFLRAAVLSRLNILISGGTGSGKTTLLNILSGFIPTDERIITVEDSAELKLQQPHVITLEARPPNIEGKGEVTIRDLVRNCLRMRPDRIVVGECRGAEALDMLQAMNTGHDGSLTTVHANSAREALSRIETLVMYAGFDLSPRVIREQIIGALDVIVQIKRFKDGKRRVVQISEVTGMEGDVITLGDVFFYKQDPVQPGGEVKGAFLATGYMPRCLALFEERGIPVPREIFWGAESASGRPS
jgi:pilus assembly protein CpaF